MWLVLLLVANFCLLFFYSFLAKKLNIVDQPRAERVNNKAVVRGGGVCVIIAFLVQYYLLNMHILPIEILCYSLATVGFITAFFFIEDIHEISYYIRFTVQFIVAMLVITYIFWQPLSEVFNFLNKYLVWTILVIGLVWFMNLYNFMDGSDGMSSTNTIFIAIGSLVVCLVAVSVIEIGAIGLAIYDVAHLKKPDMFNKLDKACQNGDIKYYNDLINMFDIPNRGKAGLDNLNHHLDAIVTQHQRIINKVKHNEDEITSKIKQDTSKAINKNINKLAGKIGNLPFAGDLIDTATEKIDQEVSKQIDHQKSKIDKQVSKYTNISNNFIDDIVRYQALLKSPFAYFVADKLSQKLIVQCHKLQPRLHLTICAIVLILSIIPFHILNRYPARIMLGDSGSISLGLICGVMMLSIVTIFGLHGMFYGLILCSYYIFETTTTLLYSISRRYNPLQPHLRHAFHKAILAGASHLSVARLVALFNALMIIIVLFISPNESISVMFLIFIIVVIMNIVLRNYLKKWNGSKARLFSVLSILLVLTYVCYLI